MTGQRQDPEQAIRQWLAEAAPERAPASLRKTLERETLHPAGQSRPWPRFPHTAVRYAGRIAAAVAILAIAGTGAYLYGTSRTTRPGQGLSTSPTETASSSPSSAPLVGDWHMVETQWKDDMTGHVSPIVGLSSGGFAAFIFDRSLQETVVYDSKDGTSWADVGSLPTKDATVAAVSESGGQVVAVGWASDEVTDVATPIAWRSTDLHTWSAAILSAIANTGANMIKVAPAGFLVWGMELSQRTGLHFSFWISADGTSWRAITGPDLQAGAAVEDLSANSAGYVIRTNTEGLIETWHSVDGVAWTKAWTGPVSSGPADYYDMGRPTLEAPDGTYLTIGSTSSYQVLWRSGDLVHWTMAGRIQLDSRQLYDAASIPGGFIAGSCGENAAGCENGSVAVWTSGDALTWHEAPGTAPVLDGLRGLSLSGFASDGTHAIVILRDDRDGIHLLVGTERK
jgi:hypothetical protein